MESMPYLISPNGAVKLFFAEANAGYGISLVIRLAIWVT
jgi:hypothetical protein